MPWLYFSQREVGSSRNWLGYAGKTSCKEKTLGGGWGGVIAVDGFRKTKGYFSQYPTRTPIMPNAHLVCSDGKSPSTSSRHTVKRASDIVICVNSFAILSHSAIILVF